MSKEEEEAISFNAEAYNDSAPSSIAPKSTNEQMASSAVPVTKSGISGASFNMANTIVGAGIVALPYAFSECGLIVGVLLLSLVGWLTAKSLNMLIKAAHFNKHFKSQNYQISTYEELIHHTFGSWGRALILFFSFLVAYGAMVAYLIIIKDTVPTILGIQEQNTWEREMILIIVSITIILPVSMQRDMASLGVTSTISMISDVILIIFIAAYSPVGKTVQDNGGISQVIHDYSSNTRIFMGLGVISTAMCCQHSSFMIYWSLKNNEKYTTWWTVSTLAISGSTILSLIIGTTGFLAYLDNVEGNVLNNLETDSLQANVARGLMAITMLFTYPMESFVARHVLVDLLFHGDIDGGTDRSCCNRRELISIGLFIVALVPALIFDHLGIVLSITGAVGASVVAYICPGLAYLASNSEDFINWNCSITGYEIEDVMEEQEDNVEEQAIAQQEQMDLPISGDGNLKITSSQISKKIEYIQNGPMKPIWWYLFGFQIWTTIAIIGYRNMTDKLRSTGNHNAEQNITGEVDIPSTWDFLVAIFLIVFGTMAFILGIVHNVIIQLESTLE